MMGKQSERVQGGLGSHGFFKKRRTGVGRGWPVFVKAPDLRKKRNYADGRVNNIPPKKKVLSSSPRNFLGECAPLIPPSLRIDRIPPETLSNCDLLVEVGGE